MDENVEKEAQPAQSPVPAKSLLPPFRWPTSKPGPKITPPPLGTKSLPGRTEQVVETNFSPLAGDARASV